MDTLKGASEHLPKNVAEDIVDDKYTSDLNAILGFDKKERPVYVGDVVYVSTMPNRNAVKVTGDGGTEPGRGRVLNVDSRFFPTTSIKNVEVILSQSPKHISRAARDKNGNRVYFGDYVTYRGDVYKVNDHTVDKVYLWPYKYQSEDSPYIGPCTVKSKLVELKARGAH